MLKKISAYIIALFILFFSVSTDVYAGARVQNVDEPVVIVIDPGHGGDNEGTKENGALEKEMTLKTAGAMYDELCKYDNVEVYMTRTSDKGMTIANRAKYASEVGADFLFSLHYNASLSHELYGSEVWIPLNVPFHSYGYQFGMVQMETMQDMGLFLRGVKTREGENKNEDYYGIIRESAALGIPAVIIEHCHVDEEHDMDYCDSEEDYIAFGKADALSVAKYFGLKSEKLGVDYSDYSADKLYDINENERAEISLNDYSHPDVCDISIVDTGSDADTLTVRINAADYNSVLLYYDYSIDGGETYSHRYPWPDSNIFEGTYTDTADITMDTPPDENAEIIFRVYNLFDLETASNSVLFEKKPEIPDEIPNEGIKVQTEATSVIPEKASLGTTTFMADNVDSQEIKPQETSIFSFMIICLCVVVLMFVIILVSQIISDAKKRKKRRQRRKELEDEIYHKR